nr:ankyrin repeat domain-containing protein [Cupriavidus sp. AU9028]
MVALALGVMPLAAQAGPTDDLKKAVEFDDGYTAQKVLAKGADPNATDRHGSPLLVAALREGSLKAARALVTAPNIDFDKQNAAGETALMLACLQGQMDLVRIMVEQRKVEVNKTGWTPLHYAATNGHTEIVRLLLDHSAYVDAESPNGTTPLMMAARGGHAETIKLLLDEGADMRIRNQQGMTVIDFAQRYSQPEVAQGLRSRWQKLYPDQAVPGDGAAPAAGQAAAPAPAPAATAAPKPAAPAATAPAAAPAAPSRGADGISAPTGTESGGPGGGVGG